MPYSENINTSQKQRRVFIKYISDKGFILTLYQKLYST